MLAGAALAESLEALIERVATRTSEMVLAQLRSELGAGAPRYATAQNNPLGSPRAFLNAHREHKFPTFRRNREIAAYWKDVETWMVTRKGNAAAVEADLSADLAKACGPLRRRSRGGKVAA